MEHFKTHTVKVEDTVHTFFMDDETYSLVGETLAEMALEYNTTFQ